MRYPRFLLAEIKALSIYQRNNPDRTSATRFKNPYNQMFYHIFCDNMEEYENYVVGGLFVDNQLDTKRFLEDYFGIDLTF